MSFFPDEIQRIAQSAGLDLAKAMKGELATEIEELIKFAKLFDNIDSSEHHSPLFLIKGAL